jgi:hypothetical protein
MFVVVLTPDDPTIRIEVYGPFANESAANKTVKMWIAEKVDGTMEVIAVRDPTEKFC